VYDLPPCALDDFLSLWAFSDIFGKTIDIDIAFIMATDVWRTYINCLDPTLILARLDIKIKGDFYSLRF
jgi:hypothetical protein